MDALLPLIELLKKRVQGLDEILNGIDKNETLENPMPMTETPWRSHGTALIPRITRDYSEVASALRFSVERFSRAQPEVEYVPYNPSELRYEQSTLVDLLQMLDVIKADYDDDQAVPAKPESGMPEPVAQSPSGSVFLYGSSEHPTVNGKTKGRLRNTQYNVVLALIQAGDEGLTKDQLDHKSGHGDARKILSRLANSDPDWKIAIYLPGVKGMGYRIL
jgi:hypothetical protein